MVEHDISFLLNPSRLTSPYHAHFLSANNNKIRHLLFAPEELKQSAAKNVDDFGDSYTRDVSVEELKQVRNLLSFPFCICPADVTE